MGENWWETSKKARRTVGVGALRGHDFLETPAVHDAIAPCRGLHARARFLPLISMVRWRLRIYDRLALMAQARACRRDEMGRCACTSLHVGSSNQAHRSSSESAPNSRLALVAVIGTHCDPWPVPPGEVVPAGHPLQVNVWTSRFCSFPGAQLLQEKPPVSWYPPLHCAHRYGLKLLHVPQLGTKHRRKSPGLDPSGGPRGRGGPGGRGGELPGLPRGRCGLPWASAPEPLSSRVARTSAMAAPCTLTLMLGGVFSRKGDNFVSAVGFDT
jgi:hypothetical protein